MGVSDLLDDLDVASVRLFLTAAELGSVSKAAARHGVTQPSATARIQKLERTIGLQLLARGPTGSVVTPDGVELISRCHALVGAAAALTEGARALLERADPTLRLATTADVATHLLPQWIASDPLDGLTIELIEGDTAELASALRNGDADLGLLAGPGAPLSLRSEIVAWLDLIAVARPDHPLLAQRRSVTGAQLAAADLIVRRRGSGTRDVIEMALAEHELGVHGRTTEVASTAAARIAALTTGRIAILPEPAVADDVSAGRLSVVRLRSIELRQPIRLAWKGSLPSHPGAHRLLSVVRSRRGVA